MSVVEHALRLLVYFAVVSDMVDGLEDQFARLLKKAVVSFLKIRFRNMLERGGNTNEAVNQDGLCSILDSIQYFSNANLKACKTYHPGKEEDTPQRDGGPGPPPIRETNIHTKI